MVQNETIHFDKRLTNICKGIAIILMIIHHIFPGMEGYGLKLGNTWVIAEIAILGKVCVSIYLFLSGYGLCESYKGKELKILQFYWRRLKAIYINYWMIFAIFTAIGYFGFREIFLTFVQTPYTPLVNLIINFLGIQYWIDYMGYNPSWWFISEILLLYLLFPLLHGILKIKKGEWVLLVLGAFLEVFSNLRIGLFHLDLIWFPSFIVGMIFSKYQLVERTGNWLLESKWRRRFMFIAICVVSWLRIYVGLTTAGVRIDCILAPAYCCIVYYLVVRYSEKRGIFNVLEYLGIHSFNIYLIHLFITNMYTTPYIYNLNSPFFMVGSTILVFLIFSILVENIKRYLQKAVRKQ